MSRYLMIPFVVLIFASCISNRYYYDSGDRVESFQVFSLLKMYNYSCVEGEKELRYRGAIEKQDSILTFIFPTDFEEKHLSPFQQNFIELKSTVSEHKRSKVSIQLKSFSKNSNIFGFVQLIENDEIVKSYKSTQTGNIEFEIDSNTNIRIFSYQTLKSDLELESNRNYEITIYLVDKATGSWNGGGEVSVERRNYPRLNFKIEDNSLILFDLSSKTYIKK